MRASSTTFSLDFEQTVDAPRSLVCQACTDPERLKAWYRPDDSWSTPLAELDLRVGGAYRIGLTPPSASTFYEVGTYREVMLPERLVYTVRYEGTHPKFEGPHLDQPTKEEMETYETVITVEFHELSAARTRVAVTHVGYRSEEDRDRHRNGWPRFLEHLATYCAAARK